MDKRGYFYKCRCCGREWQRAEILKRLSAELPELPKKPKTLWQKLKSFLGGN